MLSCLIRRPGAWRLILAALLLAPAAARADAQFFPPSSCAADAGKHMAMGWDGINQTSCTPVIYDASSGAVFLNANVGVGTASPAFPFEVNRAGAGRVAGFFGTAYTGDAEISIGNSANPFDNAVLGFNAAEQYAYFSIYGLGGDRLVMTSAGNVGIGNTAPEDKLDVNGSINVGNGQWLKFGGGTGSGYGASDSGIDFGFGAQIIRVASDGHLQLSSQANLPVEFTGRVRAQRYDDDDDSNYYADLNAGANVGGTWNFNGESVFRGPIILYHEEFNDGEWYVCHHGQHLVLGHYCSTSDRRQKTNIRPLGGGVLATLERLNPVRFEWKDPKKGKGPQIGVIAQDFEQDYPELVSASADDGMKSFDYQRFTAVLLQGLKELDKKNADLAGAVEELKATNQRLQGEIEELTGQIDSIKQ